MDEKGILLGVHSRAQVVVCRRHCSPTEKMNDPRERIAIVGCICADNSLIPVGLYNGWFIEVIGRNAKSAHFDRGCMVDKLAIERIQAFVTATKECA